MVYSTSDHKKKDFHIFLQNKNKEMETRLPMSALQKTFATCRFSLKLNFIPSLILHVKKSTQSLVRRLGWNFLRL